MVLRHFFLGFPQSGGIRQGFGDALAVDLIGQAEGGAMARIARLMAMASGRATGAGSGRDGTAPEVPHLGDLLQQGGSLLFELFQFNEGLIHTLAYHYARVCATKKRTAPSVTFMSHTPR
jgi:hypothetical protein